MCSFSVAFDVLAAQAKLTDKHFMMHELVESLIHLVRIDNDGGTVQALAYSAYWLKEQLLSGDFGVLSAGIVDVGPFCFLNEISILTLFNFQLLGTLAFKAPALKLAQLNAKLNPCKTFLYSFDYAGAFTRLLNNIFKRLVFILNVFPFLVQVWLWWKHITLSIQGWSSSFR